MMPSLAEPKYGAGYTVLSLATKRSSKNDQVRKSASKASGQRAVSSLRPPLLCARVCGIGSRRLQTAAYSETICLRVSRSELSIA